MAVQLGPLVAPVKRQIEINELSGNVIGIDAYNTIYQFLSIIRQPDGTPLTDSHGNVTSHLSGLFYRTINLIENGITPIFMFDGIPPILKRRTLESRMNRREEAKAKWEEARAKGNIEEARIHAMASTRINKEIVNESKELLRLMGIPYVQAPSEGEAQAARMNARGQIDAAASQDYDLFLFGSNVVVRNLTITGRRKLPGKNIYVNVSVERIILEELLKSLDLSRKQLIWVGMLLGTDFNEGIRGVGPKTALKVVRGRNSVTEVFDYVKERYGKETDADPREVEALFENPQAEDISSESMDAMLQGQRPDPSAIIKFLCERHDFSQERIEKFANKLAELKGHRGQKGINNWL